MKTNLLKSIFISLILVMGVSNAWAYNQSAKDLYFDNSEAKWNSCYVYIGHGTWTSVYPLTRVSGTQYLWQLAKADFNGGGSWNGATGWVLCYEKWWDNKGESIDKYTWHGDKNVTQKSTSAWDDTKIYKTNGTASTKSDNHTINAYKVTSYTKSNYTVTINTVEGGTLTVKDYDDQAVATGASKIHLTVLKFSATPASGYVLDAVEINDGTNTTTIAAADLATTTHTLTSNVTINPVWRATTSTVTVTTSATNGTVTGGGTVEEGTSVTLTATPDAGYQFVNWTVGGAEVSTANPYTFTAEEDVTVVANFEEKPPMTVYLAPNNNWKTDNARFAIYCWNSAGDIWYDMTPIDCNSGEYYKVEIPGVYSNFKFVRMNPATSENNWDYKWNETGNLTVPTDNKVLFTVTGWDSSGSWGTYSAPQYAITINNGTGGTVTVKQGENTITSGNNVDLNTIIIAALNASEGYSKGTAKIKIGNNEETDLVEGQEYTICGPTTIIGNWTANTYTVAFNANNGTGTMSDQSYTYAVSQALTANSFIREGYNFTGWNTKADGSGTSYTDKEEVSNLTSTNGGSVTLYAQWEAVKYNITYNDTYSVTHSNPKIYTIEDAITFVDPTSERTGYTFAGWNPASIAQGSTGDKTITATWTINSYTITLDANGGESNGSATATYNSSSLTNVTFPIRTDYRCTGYFTAATDGILVLNTDGTLVTNVSGYTDANGNWIKDGNATLYAQWIYDVTEYTVTFGIEAGSTSYGSLSAYNNTTSAAITSPATVRSGNNITFTATPITHYKVEGWYTDEACTLGKHNAGHTTYTTSISSETTAYVKFVETTWDVTFNATTGGTVNPSGAQTIGEANGTTISATPEMGYTFNGWTSSNGGTFADDKAEETTFHPTAATTVTANFTENLYTITVQSNNNNHGTVTPTTGEVGIATTIEVTATPESGYQFVNWTATSGITIANAESTTTTITATAAGTLTAHFELIPPQTLYLDPTGWTGDNARFSVYYWNSEGHAWADMVKVDANSSYYTVDIPAGYQDIMMVRLDPTKPENNWDNDWDQSGNLTIPTNGNNLYVLNNKTVSYLHLKPNENWKQANARFAAYFFGNGERWVDLEKKGDYYTCSIPTDKKFPSVIFCRMNPSTKDNNWTNKWNQTIDLTIQSQDNLYTVANDAWDENNETKGSWSRLWDDSQWSTYTPSVNITENTGDYRLVYVESEVLGTAPYTKFHPSQSISYQASDTKQDIVSFYINKDGQNPAILLQQCTTDGTTITWNTVAAQSINGVHGDNSGGAMAPAKRTPELYISNGCPAVTGNGVYNFVLQQTDGEATILSEETHAYVGNYYIRSYCTKGGWYDYLDKDDNLMTHSEASLIYGNYDYYFCKWIHLGKNIKYTIANDYSPCISDTLVGDDIAITSILPADANVRFTWNSKTNALERAYLSGSGNAKDRYLVLVGDNNLQNTSGQPFTNNEAYFKDMENWLYQLDVKANENTHVKLTANYNGKTQYFKGSETTTEQLIDGTAEHYALRLIYDFKTNYLVSGLVGNQEITGNLELEEVMIVRSHHEEAQTVRISGEGSVTAQQAYGVMTFNKETLNDGTKSQHERALYWVSFPFDVKLDEVFGFGNYGEHWIMEYYDGAERAEKGLWVDAGTYWKYIENPEGYTLEVGKGYVLCLNLDLLGNSAAFWDHDNTEISLYFPSDGQNAIVIDNNPTKTTTTVDAHECTINRPGNPDTGDRRIKDSNWNIIGVPAYTKIAEINSQNLNFYYQYIAGDDPETEDIDETNSYRVQKEPTFNTMHAYMVQFAGEINWMEKVVSFAAIAARKSPASKNQYTLRLALQQEGTDHDHTFIRLQEDNATAEFDMNYDLCKIINRGANIYSMINNVEVAANVLPVEERVIPIGLDIHETGNYTFAMPDGTDGITAILIDYETGKETNLLLADYTTELREGTNNERFALRVRPNHVATAVETIIDGANGQIQKYIINGALYILNNGQLYDAQGRMVQQ